MGFVHRIMSLFTRRLAGKFVCIPDIVSPPNIDINYKLIHDILVGITSLDSTCIALVESKFFQRSHIRLC